MHGIAHAGFFARRAAKINPRQASGRMKFPPSHRRRGAARLTPLTMPRDKQRRWEQINAKGL